MLEQFIFPQEADLHPNIIYHEDTLAPPPHTHTQHTHFEFACSRIPQRHLAGSLDWTRRATAFAGCDSSGFVFYGYSSRTEPHLPTLQTCICDVTAAVTPDILGKDGKKLSTALRLTLTCLQAQINSMSFFS
jgi:hypothetical protein